MMQVLCDCKEVHQYVISRAAAGIAVYKGEKRVKKIYTTYDKSMD